MQLGGERRTTVWSKDPVTKTSLPPGLRHSCLIEHRQTESLGLYHLNHSNSHWMNHSMVAEELFAMNTSCSAGVTHCSDSLQLAQTVLASTTKSNRFHHSLTVWLTIFSFTVSTCLFLNIVKHSFVHVHLLMWAKLFMHTTQEIKRTLFN